MDSDGGAARGRGVPPDGPARRGLARRGFLAAALAGVATVVLASCTGDPRPTPTPSPTSTPTPSPTPTPTPTATPLPEGIPEPTAFRRTRWTADPFARGAFSFDQIGTTPDLRETLRTSVDDRIWFAGEAASSTAPGTLEGAFESGRSTAAAVARVARRGERIAVIGAGIAGLAAARDLVDRDRDYEVVVVEARDRVGGRIHSVDDGAFGRTIELGTVLTGYDDELGRLLDEASVDGAPLMPPTEARTVDGVWTPVQQTGADALAAAHAWAETWPFDVGLRTALDATGAPDLSTDPGLDGVSPADWLDWALASGVEPETGSGPAQLSARSFDPARLRRPSQLVRTRLADAIDELAASLDVALTSVVTRIARIGDRVSLRFETGESLRVDRVVVTAPLGVLKTDTIRFEPRLPRAHQRAITVLGMGAVDLVWLRFDEAFWRSDAPEPGDSPRDVLTVVGQAPAPVAPDDDADADPDTDTDPEASAPAGSVVGAWIDVGRADDEPILVGVVAGPRAERLEALDDDEALAAVLEDLRPFLPGGVPLAAVTPDEPPAG